MSYDVVIAGGGPAGLSAALVLGRARKRVLVCDAGPRRNATAEHVHGFLTRDGASPEELRRIAREQLSAYDSVQVRDVRVDGIAGERGAFDLQLTTGAVRARRVLLCMGVIDELPELPGFRELWGKAIFQCPYCHGWEVRDRPLGYLAPSIAQLEWAVVLRSWSDDVLAFTDARFAVPPETRALLGRMGVRLEERRILRILPTRDREALDGIEVDDGARIARDVLFAHPPQLHVDLVTGLELAHDAQGFVEVDRRMQTSRPGIYAAGDLAAGPQSALSAASAGAFAAVMLNHDLVPDGMS